MPDVALHRFVRTCLGPCAAALAFAAPTTALAWPMSTAHVVAPTTAPTSNTSLSATKSAPPTSTPTTAAPPPTATTPTPAAPISPPPAASTATPTAATTTAPAAAGTTPVALPGTAATPPAAAAGTVPVALPGGPPGTPPASATGPATTPLTGEDTPTGELPLEEEAEPGEFGRPPILVFHGAMEAYYAWNFNQPSNDINNWRWYDTRHNTLGLQGLWFVPEFEIGPVKGHFQLQLGALAELFWPSERSFEEDIMWRLLQEATMEWTTPWKRLSIEGGIFNVPFGPEWNLAFRNWNWSTGNLFALMPYQITGFRANFDLGSGMTARIGVYNGWDRIVLDNNKQKAMMASLEWTDANDEENYVYFNYMVGNERYDGKTGAADLDPRGKAARHTFDLYGQWHMAKPFTMRLWTFSGLEYRDRKLDGWLGLSLYAKVDPLKWMSIALRGDYVYTRADTSNLWFSDLLDNPATSTNMGSGTATISFKPHSNVLFRLEGRYDRSSFPLYYRGNVQLSDAADPRSFVPNARTQTTLLAGMTTFF